MSGNSDGIAAERYSDPWFVHPKIFAVDLSEEDITVTEIRAGGFNVAAGSFGTPRRGRKIRELRLGQHQRSPSREDDGPVQLISRLSANSRAAVAS
jgi:hypothetical protein